MDLMEALTKSLATMNKPAKKKGGTSLMYEDVHVSPMLIGIEKEALMIVILYMN